MTMNSNDNPAGRRAFTAAVDDAGGRLDRVLAKHLPSLSRSRLQALIKAGRVKSLGRTIKEADHRVKSGDEFEIELPPPAPAGPLPEAIPLTVKYEDDAVIVIDKPAGLVVHPAAGHRDGTLVNALLAHCGASLSGIGGVQRPGIVHRLDKDTSGLMVIAKTGAAHHKLAGQFADHGRSGGLERRYLALIWGAPHPGAGVIRTQIGRHATNRQKMAVLAQGGKRAITNYLVAEKFTAFENRPGKNAVASLIECGLETGRTHQVRVHMAYLGYPIIGDPLYGAGFQSKIRALPEAVRFAIMSLGRQALHAAILRFKHPISGSFMSFESQLPDDMMGVKQALRSLTRRG